MTDWFTKKPGMPPIHEEEDGSASVLIGLGDGLPDWVRSPPELGSQRLKPLRRRWGNCGRCGATCPTLELEKGFLVFECSNCEAFIWARQQ